jgi:hypothetical protein
MMKNQSINKDDMKFATAKDFTEDNLQRERIKREASGNQGYQQDKA